MRKDNMRKDRGTGRRDPDRTRRAIVAAAAAEFSAHGPAGARVDRIAAAAGVNKRMIYHYFGSKAGLWSGMLGEWSIEPVLPDGHDAASIAAELTRGAMQLAERPAVTRLLAWEALTPGFDTGSPSLRAASWRARVARLQDAQRAGRLSPRVDAAQLELALAALLLFPYAFPQIAEMISGCAIADPEFGRARDAFFVAFEELLSLRTPAAAPPNKPRFRLAAAVTEIRR